MSAEDCGYEIIDPSFRELVLPNAWVEKLYGGCRWAEGPVYFTDGDFLVWSDIPNNRMMRWVPGLGVSVFRQFSNYSNGNTRDQRGRLVSCEQGGRRVTRTQPDGTIEVIADHYQGKRLNSPNDVVVASDDSIWFTDPTYGIHSDYEGYKAQSEIGACYVYRWDADSGELSVVADDFLKPNGLAFSPDESQLYIADTGATHTENGPHHIRVFDVIDGATLANGRVFAEIDPGLADGFRLDVQGNVWTSAGDGVHCYSPAGKLLGKIRIPEVVANLTFGGPKRNQLFIAATSSIYAVYVGVAGAQRP
jgi:gluconolactonase